MVEKANAQEARGCAYLPELVRSGLGIVGIVIQVVTGRTQPTFTRRPWRGNVSPVLPCTGVAGLQTQFLQALSRVVGSEGRYAQPHASVICTTHSDKSIKVGKHRCKHHRKYSCHCDSKRAHGALYLAHLDSLRCSDGM